MCAGIHLYLHLPAIYAYAYTNSASAVANRDCYFDCNCHGDFYSYFHPNYDSTTNSDIYAYGDLDDYTQANAYAEAGYNAERTTHSAAAPVIWGAQAASLHVSAACRDGKMEIIRQLTAFKMLPEGLPATTG